MRIYCKMATSNTKLVDVNPSDQLLVLMSKLNITDKKTKFIYNSETYSLSQSLTFEEIGMVDNAQVYVNNQGISGINR